MNNSIWTFANPHNFMRLSGVVAPWAAALAAITLAIGLGWSLFATPPDYQQKETIKIFFIHVPAAMMAVNIYAVMVIASLIGLIRSHPVSHLVAKAAAPIGAAFTLVAIITGALWGQPMWGAWWVWDARLTSVLILLFFYLGYLALWNAIEDPVKAADLASILCLVGSLFAFMSRYAVEFWNTLHQGASLSLDKESHVADVYYAPLLVMILGVYLLFIALLMVGVRTEIRARRLRALRIAQIGQADAALTRTAAAGNPASAQ
ncbi:MAG: heme ABC transporter permease [Rhodobacteraceae bacterium]|nr:heme ABC transporter permease [Paracoccaceae bacterium]